MCIILFFTTPQGAHFNSSDVVLSGAQLLSLMASQPGGGNKAVTDSRAHYLLGQVGGELYWDSYTEGAAPAQLRVSAQ